VDITLGEIAEVLGAQLCCDGSTRIKGVSIDSRTLKKGMLFFALRGDNYDGHSFLGEVFEKGAVGAVVDGEKISSNKYGNAEILLKVVDPLRALQDVASYYRRKFNIPVISVTGTNGKTTTKEMIAAVLSTRYRVVKSPGNLNNHIGVALSICNWNRNEECAVVEMGTNHFGEIRRLCEIARPTHGLITNIGKGHLEFFGNEEGVVKAKSELLQFLDDKGKAFLNGDDQYLFPLKDRVSDTVTYGFSDRCDIRGYDLGVDESGFPSMKIGEEKIKIFIPGRHNLINGLAAAAVGRSFEISWEDIRDSLESYRPMKKRMEIVESSGIMIINDTYNANPVSVHHALSTLSDIKKIKRRIVVLGDMLELGKSSEVEHRKIGELISDLGIDIFFSYGTEMKAASKRAKELGVNVVEHFDSKAELATRLQQIIKPDDGILVKGSRGMRMEEVVEMLQREKSQE